MFASCAQAKAAFPHVFAVFPSAFSAGCQRTAKENSRQVKRL
jgi:peroxiredoxin